MLIVNDEHRIAAGMKSLSKRCSYCCKPLKEYPLIMNDDVGFHVFHAACAAALAIDIQVDLCTFFNPPAPFHQFFVLTTQEAGQSDEQGGAHAVNQYQRDQGGVVGSSLRGCTQVRCPMGGVVAIRKRKGQLMALVRGWGRWYPVESVTIEGWFVLPSL